MDEKALDALRIGLEDSYWYGDDDEKVFNELVRKAEAFDKIVDAHQNVLKDIRIRGAKLPADLDKFALLSERIINQEVKL